MSRYPQHELDADYYQEMIGRFDRIEQVAYAISDGAVATADGSFLVTRKDLVNLRLALGEPVMTREQRTEYERTIRRVVNPPKKRRRPA